MSVRNRHNASSIVQDKKLIIVLTLFINVFVRGTLHAFADNISFDHIDFATSDARLFTTRHPHR